MDTAFLCWSATACMVMGSIWAVVLQARVPWMGSISRAGDEDISYDRGR